MLQGFLGGSDPTADVGNVFAWVLGWVGVALFSALVGPIWPWLDPFSTLHRLLSAAGERLGITSGGGVQREWPERLGRWPAARAGLIAGDILTQINGLMRPPAIRGLSCATTAWPSAGWWCPLRRPCNGRSKAEWKFVRIQR